MAMGGRNNEEVQSRDILYSTLSATAGQQTVKMKETLKSKLSYEWKKIYRILNLNDS